MSRLVMHVQSLSLTDAPRELNRKTTDSKFPLLWDTAEYQRGSDYNQAMSQNIQAQSYPRVEQVTKDNIYVQLLLHIGLVGMVVGGILLGIGLNEATTIAGARSLLLGPTLIGIGATSVLLWIAVKALLHKK